MTKLVKVRESTHERKSLKEDNLFGDGEEGRYGTKHEESSREVKKWIIPQGYCLEKGKIMPDSVFFSDKTVLAETKKSRIVEVSVWVDSDDIPNIIQFRYQDEKKKHIEGIQPIPYPSSSLELNVFKLKEGDYLHKIKGTFFEG